MRALVRHLTSACCGALRLAAWPVLISLFVTPVHMFLELAGGPTVFVFPLGLLWLALGFAVFLGTRLGEEERPYLLLLLSLVVFSPPSRFPVFVRTRASAA